MPFHQASVQVMLSRIARRWSQRPLRWLDLRRWGARSPGHACQSGAAALSIPRNRPSIGLGRMALNPNNSCCVGRGAGSLLACLAVDDLVVFAACGKQANNNLAESSVEARADLACKCRADALFVVVIAPAVSSICHPSTVLHVLLQPIALRVRGRPGRRDGIAEART